MQNNRQSDAKKVKNPTVIQTCSSSQQQQQSHCTQSSGGGGGISDRKNGKNMSSNRNKPANSNNSTPTKTDTEFKDSSDSDEESVSEVDSFPIDQESIEIPESYSDSTINEEDDDDNEDVSINYEDDEDGDEEDSAGSEDDDDSPVPDADQNADPNSPDTKARLEALLEAADEAAMALTKKSVVNSPMAALQGKSVISRSLIAACSDNDMSAVRKILGENGQHGDGSEDSDSLLSLACSAGYLELAQVLLAMSAKIDDRGIKNECTPLMEASSAGHHEIIDLLVRHGAEVNATSSSGNTPLMYACAGGHVTSVKILLGHGANVEDHNENGHTPLMEAASAGHVAVARLLLEHGAGINTHSNEFKESALTLACYKGHLDMVRFLLEAGADQEHKTDEMHTALMEASMDGHVEVARLLLDSGAQVNMPTDSFESPLTLAACGGHVDLALLLIERGANIEEVNDEGYTPLMEAAREGHEEMVALLLSQNANINAQTEETQETALTLACCGGFLEVADYLIKHGADIELGASTPLMEAAQEGHIELVKFLLENRANVHAQTQTGDTALTYACENGHTDVAEILLLYGAELEHESEGGRTPLMKACRAGHHCTVQFLLGRNAEINKPTTNNDHTPLSLACAGGHKEVVKTLLANGADMFHKLKDNSTMLIEAAKGGHLLVVQILLDYPTSLNAAAVHQNDGTMPPLVPLKNNLHLMSPAMATPPGLPDTIRANQFPMQQQTTDNADQVAATAAAEFLPYHHDYSPAFTLSTDPTAGGGGGGVDVQKSSAATPYEESPNSLIAQMRKLATNTNLNKGFKDGLMQGLISNNANAAAAVAAAAAAVASSQQQQTDGASGTIPTKFSDPTNMIPSNVDPEPFEGFNQAALMGHQRLENYLAEYPNETIEDIKKKLILGTKHIVGLGYDLNAWPRSIPNHGGLMCGSGVVGAQNMTNTSGGLGGGGSNNSMLPTTANMASLFGGLSGNAIHHQQQQQQQQQMQQQMLHHQQLPIYQQQGGFEYDRDTIDFPRTDQMNTVLATVFTGPSQDNLSSVLAPNEFPNEPVFPVSSTTPTTTAPVAPSKPTVPGEVSQSTAIADRPKVKPVSKKDGKYIKKSSISTVLQTPTPQLSAPTSEQSMQTLQQGFSNLSIKNTLSTAATATPVTAASNNNIQSPLFQQPLTLTFQPQQLQTPMAGIKFTAKSTKMSPAAPTPAATNNNNVIVPNTAAITVPAAAASPPLITAAPAPFATSSIDMAADDLKPASPLSQQWSQDMLQRIVQRLAEPDPMAMGKSVSGGSDMTNFFGAPSSPTNKSNTSQMNFHLSEADIEAFYSQLAQINPNIFPQKSENKSDIDDDEEYIENVVPQVVYPLSEDANDMFQSIEDSFNAVDVSFENDGTREGNCSLEWVECFDEVLSALNNLPVDIPGALQEFAANCSDLDYANLFGMNTYCKARWADQWSPQNLQVQQSASPINVDDESSNMVAQIEASDEQHHHHRIIQGENGDVDDDDEDDDDEDDDDDDEDDDDVDDEDGDVDLRQPQQTSHIAFDHEQLQQHLQHELSLQHFQLLNQLQNQQHQLPLIPVPLDQQQNQQNMLNIHQAQQVAALQQGQAGQMQQTVAQSVVDAQQQAKFVFNVDTEKPTQSLQLLFQLPPVSQGGHTQPPTASIITQQQQQQQQQQQTSQVVAQTQTCQQQQQQQPHSIQVLRPNALENQQQQHCTQHQVATQTSTTQSTNIQMPPSIAPRHVQTEVKGKLTTKKAEKRLKDKRFPTRPTPTGQQSGASGASGGFQFDQSGLPLPQFTAAAPQTNASAAAAAAAAAVEPVHKIDVDSETDSNHDTALTLACAGGHEELVVLLLERGASIEHRDKKGFTPLILAATAGHVKVVEILIREKADLEAQSERTKDTPLSLACSGGRYEVVELLLKHNANKEHRNVSDYTPLSLAASGGYVNIIKMLLNHGAEINSRTGSKLGISPLMLAAMNGHTQAVKLLLDMGSDINAQIETNRNTALTLACFQGRHEVVSLLLDRKANVEHRAKTGLTPLMEAASGGYIEVGRVLIDKGADVNAAPVPSSRDTALTIASDKGHLKFVELLLTRNALVEVKNKKGNSPLWLAANGGHLGVVEALYEYNADIDSQDNRKVSCLMAAFRKGHIKVVEWMVEHVSQFPSDQEMTRFINTISDKDILTKCHECVKIIKAAKETQARKAYMNASILLRELETEKNREEQRKAAAAKRRERKKRRKQEKKELQRKAEGKDDKNHKNRHQKDEEPEDSDDDDSDDSDDDMDEEEDVMPEPPKPAPVVALHPVHHQPELRQEKEEGDSGIDANSQGSCSSSDAKPQSTADPKLAKRRNKQKKQPINNRASNSPEVVLPIVKPPTPVEKPKKAILPIRKPEPSKKTVEKENLAPKEEVKPVRASEKKEEKAPPPVKPEVRKVFNSSYRHSVEHPEVTEPQAFHSSNNKKLNIKQHAGDTISPNKNHGKREEGWKEVTRKSSVQQNLPQEVKKVFVPTNAISRVIGRGGSNINAIRAATGAIIEVEKQGKIQQDRCITIKGSAEATKNAQLLIDTLINDSDVDILQVLEREGIGKVTQQTSGQIVIGTWDKSKPSSTTSSQDGDAATTKKRVGAKGRSTTAKNLFEVRSKAPSTASTAPRVRVSSPVKSAAPKVTTSVAAVKSTQSFASRVSATVATPAPPTAIKKLEKPVEKSAVTSKPLPVASSSSVSAAATTIPTTTTAKLEQRSITPIGPVRNVTPTPVLPTSVSAPNSAVKSRGTEDSGIGSQIHSIKSNNMHGGQSYQLFNDIYGGQWDNKQYTASIAATKAASSVGSSYIGQEPIVIDASKAPGYRGTNISSPVSSKTSSQSTTPPSSMQPLPTSITTNTIQPIAKPYTSANELPVVKQQQQQPIPVPTPIQPPPPANLAVQRPSVPMRPISETFGPPPSQQPRERLFDAFPQPSYYESSGYQPQQPQQQQQQQPLTAMNTAALQMSRLNPKASSFSSSMQAPPPQAPPIYSKQPPQTANPYNPNMYSAYQQQQQQQQQQAPLPQTQPPPIQKMMNAGGAPPMYGQRPPMRWYGAQDMQGAYNPREVMNFENGGQMHGSPSMSPNTMPQNQNGLVADDGRKIPRPIGTERSWKAYTSTGANYMEENGNNMAGAAPWQMDNMKPPMTWMQPPIGAPRVPYEDLNPAPQVQDHFPAIVEYQNLMGGPNQPNMNFMHSLQYPQYLPGPNEPTNNMEQPTWDQDKMAWSTKWTQ